MNRDTYARFLRSEAYKELLLGGKKKVSIKFSNRIISIHITLFFFGQTYLNMHIHNNKNECNTDVGCVNNCVNLMWDNEYFSFLFYSLTFFFVCCCYYYFVFSYPKNTDKK
jgi:hypothetical protein